MNDNRSELIKKKIDGEIITQTIENSLEWFVERLPEKVKRNIIICEKRKSDPEKYSYQRIGNLFGMPWTTVRHVCKSCL